MSTPPEPVTALRNLGPAVAAEMAKAGIHDAETLREMGADEAYSRMLRAGTRPHFIGFYVLHMALQGRPWNDCKGEERLPCAVALTRSKLKPMTQPPRPLNAR